MKKEKYIQNKSFNITTKGDYGTILDFSDFGMLDRLRVCIGIIIGHKIFMNGKNNFIGTIEKEQISEVLK